MTPFLSYLLKANLVLILLYGFYLLCFRRDTFYGHIRWYLLATIVSAIIFPLVNISGWLAGSPAVVEVSQYVHDMNVVYQYVLAQPQITEYPIVGEPATAARTIPFALIIWWCWLPVAVFLSGKRLFQLACIARLWYRYPRQRYGNKTIIAVDRDIQPFSFSGRIFLDPSLYSENELNEIVAHEQVHCRQGHTVDILLAETLVCLCWFNPVAWLLRRDLKQNLEYDTDRRTLQAGFDRKHYQYSLLRVSGSAFQIVNHFHFNHLKKRIIMMNKKDSPRILTVKYLMVVPVLAAALLTVQISGLQAQMDVTNLPASDIPINVTIGKTVDGVVTQDSSTHPLYPNGYPTIILDGEIVPYQEINKVDREDVDKLYVFRDGSGVAPAGNENGVVLITTKTTSRFLSKKSFLIQDGIKDDSIIPDYRIRQGTTLTQSRELLLNDRGSEIMLNAMNIPEGSVVVTAAGIQLVENADYTVDYSTSRIKILNSGLLESGTPIKVSIESNALYAIQQKNMLGTNINPKNGDTPGSDGFEVVNVTKNGVTGVTLVTTKKSFAHGWKDSPMFSENRPLYIVDGKEINSIQSIAPENIQSITILKDQSAVTLYGEKAKNGVIIITTKGKE